VPFLKITPDRNLGEVLAVAVHSKACRGSQSPGDFVDRGPVYGNATTYSIRRKGNFVREIAHGVYGLAYAHSVRFDKYDNLWIVDKAAMSVIKLNQKNCSDEPRTARRRPDEPRYRRANPPPTPVDAMSTDRRT